MSFGDDTESSVLKACTALLDVRGLLWFRSQSTPAPLPGGGFRRYTGLRGLADLVVVLPPDGRALFVECKSPRGRVRPEQQLFLDRAARDGAEVCVIWDVGQLDRLLAELLGG